MKQEKLLDCIVDEIYKIIKKTPNKEFKLTTLINKIKKDKSISSNIETNSVYEKLQVLITDNKDDDIITYKNTSNKYLIRLKNNQKTVINNDDNEIIEKDTKNIIYSVFILLNIFLYSYIAKNIHINTTIEIIRIGLLLFSFILIKNEKNSNFLLFFMLLSSIMILEIKNSVALIFIIVSFGLLKIYSKYTDENIVSSYLIRGIIIIIMFVLYIFSQYYIGPFDYIILNIILISSLTILFFILNRFNVLQSIVFFAISFSTYSLLSNTIKMLNEKNLIFYPYDDINIQISLFSIAVSILIFTNTSLSIFFENLLGKLNRKKFKKALFYIALFYIIQVALGALTFGINGMRIFVTLFFMIMLIILFLMINGIGLKEKPKYIPLMLFDFEKSFFNSKNEIKSINIFNNFLKPLNKNNDIKFDFKIYSKNILFSFLALYIIFKFFFSYQYIYHYTENDNTCINIDENILIFEKSGENFVYSLYKENQKDEILENNKKLKKDIENLENRKNRISISTTDIYETLNNIETEQEELKKDLKRPANFEYIDDLKSRLNRNEELTKRHEMWLNIIKERIYPEQLTEVEKKLYYEIKTRKNDIDTQIRKIDGELELLNNIKIKRYTFENFKAKISFDDFYEYLGEILNLNFINKESKYFIFKEQCEKI
jgi:hypothetical protein